MKQEVKNFEDKVIKEINLDKSIFGLDVKNEIIHRMIRYQLAKKDQVIIKLKEFQRFLEPLENLLNKRVQEALDKEVEDHLK